jgi:hypothetical protein
MNGTWKTFAFPFLLKMKFVFYLLRKKNVYFYHLSIFFGQLPELHAGWPRVAENLE